MDYPNDEINESIDLKSIVSDRKCKLRKVNGTVRQKERKEGRIKECFDFIEMFGKILGWELSYKWKINPRHIFAVSYLTFTWSQFLYSQFKYFMDGEYERIFEVFAVYGVAISVKICLSNYSWK